MSETTTRKCTKCLKILDKSCFSFVRKAKGTLQAQCKICVRKISSAHYFMTKEARTIQVNKWKESNRSRVKELDRIWSMKNRDKKNSSHRKFLSKNPDHHAKKRVRKLKAFPGWLTASNIDCIKSIYAKAKEYTKLTGVLFHVDHIIPLRGKNVSGLHVPENLRITTQQLNQFKGNSFNNERM